MTDPGEDRIGDMERRLSALEERLQPRTSGRRTQWTATRERAVIKCLIKRLHQEGYIGHGLVAALRELVPYFDELFEAVPSDRAIVARAYWGSHPSTISEWPEVHPITRDYWEISGTLIERGTPVTREELAHIIKYKQLQPPLMIEHKRG